MSKARSVLMAVVVVASGCTGSSPTVTDSGESTTSTANSTMNLPVAQDSAVQLDDLVDVLTFPIVGLPGCGNVDLVNGDIAIAQDRFVPGGEFDQLRDFSGVIAATAVIEATVAPGEAQGVPLPSGYLHTQEGELPLLTQLLDVELATVLRPDRLARLEPAIAAGELTLSHWNGYLEPGHRYAMFVAPGDPHETMLLYAHDLETDLPALGFLSEASARILGSLEATQPVGCNIDRLTQLALDSIEVEVSDTERSPLLSAAYQLVQPEQFENYLDTTYPLLDVLGSYSGPEVDDGVLVEALLLSDEPGVYALRGAKYFGRSPINDLGQTIIHGIVPDGATFASVVWTDRDGEATEVQLFTDDSELTIVRSPEVGVAHLIVDLTEDQRASDYLDGARAGVVSFRQFLVAASDVGSDGLVEYPAELLDAFAPE